MDRNSLIKHVGVTHKVVDRFVKDYQEMDVKDEPNDGSAPALNTSNVECRLCDKPQYFRYPFLVSSFFKKRQRAAAVAPLSRRAKWHSQGPARKPRIWHTFYSFHFCLQRVQNSRKPLLLRGGERELLQVDRLSCFGQSLFSIFRAALLGLR